MSKKRLVVTDQSFGGTAQERAAAEACGANFSDNQCADEAQTLAATGGAQVVLNNFAPMTRRVLAGLAPGATVVRYGVGTDNVDLEAARQLGVRVCNVPDYGIEEVADHAAALALALARRLRAFDAGIRAGDWRIGAMVEAVPSLRQATVGILGMGRIAQAFARRMAGFGCALIGHDPYVSNREAEARGIEPVPRDALIARADILSLHVPLTPETRHVIDAKALARMKRGAILINVSRGGLVDDDALAASLSSGHLAGAGLDVFETEPLAPDAALRKAPNAILSPHAAFYSDASVRRLQQLAAEEAMRALRGEQLRCALT
ncbi:C-terminal binding protein [Stappia sp.]|uniref:C-terminal binding protein n=1 Tax=Stappia sp. TaxID=1870903 RepID=UPI003A993C41